MSFENPLWGATKMHGELLKLGIRVAQSTVSIYMVPRRGRPLQTWKTFLHNHAEGLASIDLFVVPTIAFQQLFACLVLGHKRRQLLWFAVTRNPTAEWLARQITDAFPWDTAPKYLIRDNDRAFGAAFKARVRAMGIRDRPLQTWMTFLRNHMEGIASIDLFVVPTIGFQQLFAFLVLGHKRRQLLWFAVTRNPTAEWLARQITEAFPWDTAHELPEDPTRRS